MNPHSTKPKLEASSPLGGPATPSAPSGPDQTGIAAAADPKEIGQYRVVRVLGQGGMGRVYEAEDPALSRRVAIKVLRPALALSPVARERFVREARAAAAVVHDHIVPIYHVGDEEQSPYLVMPLLGGETLEDRLQRLGRLPHTEAIRIAREAAAGLAAAHQCGVVHRDIKPANLWLEDRGSRPPRARLLDFGLARGGPGDQSLTQDGEVLGTPAYMSPEQAIGASVDARTDLYSLGGMIYRMVSGEAPPRADSKGDKTLKLPAGLPAELSSLIDALLAYDPAQRPASAAEVEQRLAQMEDSVPAAPRTRFLWAAVAAVGLIAVTVAAGLALWPRSQAPTPSTGAAIGPDPQTVESRDRPVAAWVQRRGGTVFVSVDGDVRRIGPKKQLPPETFQLRGVDLYGIQSLRGDDFRELQGLRSLELLWIDNTPLSNDDIRLVGTLTTLRELDLSSTRITDEALVHLQGLSRLEVLISARTKIGDAGVGQLKNLRAITHLVLDETTVSDASLDYLAQLPYLVRVSARFTDISYKAARHFESQKPGCKVELGAKKGPPKDRQDREPTIEWLQTEPQQPKKGKK